LSANNRASRKEVCNGTVHLPLRFSWRISSQIVYANRVDICCQIIEEGPITIAPPETVRALEQGACRLARSVNYQGAGTVEYLFSMETGEFYFLELNPRLQVSSVRRLLQLM
jgi:hypothetical protein